MISVRAALATLAAIGASVPAHAAVIVSTAPTQNMNCSDGTCVPTATKAVLNASDLENDLSQFGNVRVMTTGSGVEANNIEVKTAFTSPDSTSLTLEAHTTITINAAVSIGSGTAELELQSDTLAASDALSFGKKGHITFGSLSDIFGINGGIFTLVGSVQELASAVAANPSGAFALANSYDASQDVTYSNSPIETNLMGTFEGLGNEISNLAITVPILEKGIQRNVGLFAEIDGEVSDVGVTHAILSVERVRKGDRWAYLGALAGENTGTVSRCYSSGTISVRDYTYVGGLIGWNSGTITESFSGADIKLRGNYVNAGGLVGLGYGQITLSYATGNVVGARTLTNEQYEGGLAGTMGGSITNSYATGSVTGAGYPNSGGFVSETLTDGQIGESYSIGTVSSGDGGFVCSSYGTYVSNYWDTTTSGTGDGGCGGNVSGITGLTTQQLQSGLPADFDPKIWAENPNINNGLPYLINNPPPK